jgi:hypothetical protein
LPLACAADCYIWERGCLIFRDCKALSVACSAITVRSLRGHDGALNEAPTSLFFLHFFFPVYYFFFSLCFSFFLVFTFFSLTMYYFLFFYFFYSTFLSFLFLFRFFFVKLYLSILLFNTELVKNFAL